MLRAISILSIGFYLNAAAYEVVEDLNSLQILTPSLKNRKTIKIRLENGLEAYIVSDPDANQSAAALSVECGSIHDPEEYPGMAHFCEHMLFMGSKKYPDENTFWKKITDNCGITNAYTKPDRTVYMFSINHENFTETLDVFSGFFTGPLFKTDAVKRELNAVNQEHLKNIENDGWREFMVLKETCNQKNPMSKFSTGTAATLSIIPIETLRSWYQSNYTANQMHLVIYSKEPLETLIATTVSTFSEVQSGSICKPGCEPLFSAGQKGHITYIEPIKNLKRVSLAWEMSSEAATDGDGKLSDLIAYALNYKGEHSLFQSLREEGFIEGLYAESDRLGKNLVLLNLSIDLTKSGLQNLDEVFARVFQTLSHLKQTSIPPHFFNEYKKMSDIDYQWQSRYSAFEYVSDMADTMVDEPLSTFPLKSTSIYAYKPKALQEVLLKMTPENTVFFVTAPSELTKQKLDKQEKWMNVSYTTVRIDEQKLNLWAQVKPNPKLGISSPNKFIPNNLNLISGEKEPLSEVPEVLVDDPFGKCYFVRDTYYLIPSVSLQIGIKSPLITAQVKSIACTDLFVLYLHRKLTPTLFSANRAGLSAGFSKADLKLYLSVDGYSDKIGLLTNTLIDALKGPTLSREHFELIKDELSNTYENQSLNLPYFQASSLLLNNLYNNYPLGSELFESLKSLTYEEFCSFQETVLNQAYLEGTISGNIESAGALELWKQMQKNLAAAIYPNSDHIKKKILLLPEAAGPYLIKKETPLQGNAAILMLQFKDTRPPAVIAEQILSKATSEAFFNTLRTKQQIAYIAKSWGKEEENELLLFFAVHSATHPPEELLARFELFLEDFSHNFETYVPEERFSAIKQSIIINLSKSPDNLSDYASELNRLAFTWNGDFTKKSKLIKAAEALSYNEFKESSLAFLSRQNTKRIAFLVQGATSPEMPFFYSPVSPIDLKIHQQ
jgi:insulysin